MKNNDFLPVGIYIEAVCDLTDENNQNPVKVFWLKNFFEQELVCTENDFRKHWEKYFTSHK